MKNIEYIRLGGTPYDDGEWIKFMIPPMDHADCGTAIGELENDLPFNQLKVYGEQDSIVAKSTTEVLSLFETNLMGGFKTPYSIEVE